MIGGKAKDGTDRYFKPEGGKWTYLIPSYAADRMLKEHEKPADEKPADEKATDEKAAAEKTAEDS